ncbi:MerR family transcriptional regulator [Sphingobacterium tabacisoli]|uniref:Helix-turn-helix domain-containing protein n=1 Tax=Sphingobacterium tabacisoli TaxID=2044855 RepID=A0ABW5KZN8_9SPHI|nr:hypothetical protein [Sphingobacterium tabacisoli]
MKNKDFKAAQEGAWACRADGAAHNYRELILGRIDDLFDLMQAFHTSQSEYLERVLTVLEQALPRLCAQQSIKDATSVADLGEDLTEKLPVSGRRKTIHISDLVLAEGDWLMTTQEALDVLNFSRGTLVSHREQGLVTEVRIGKEGGGVRFISSEVMRLRELYSVPKGKV